MLVYFVFFSGHWNGVSIRQKEHFWHLLPFAFNRPAKVKEAAEEICGVLAKKRCLIGGSRVVSAIHWREVRLWKHASHRTVRPVRWGATESNYSLRSLPRMRQLEQIMECTRSTIQRHLYAIENIQKLGVCFKRQQKSTSHDFHWFVCPHRWTTDTSSEYSSEVLPATKYGASTWI